MMGLMSIGATAGSGRTGGGPPPVANPFAFPGSDAEIDIIAVNVVIQISAFPMPTEIEWVPIDTL